MAGTKDIWAKFGMTEEEFTKLSADVRRVCSNGCRYFVREPHPRKGMKMNPCVIYARDGKTTKEQSTHRSALEEGKDFLRQVLEGGPMVVGEIKKQATEARISEATLRRAKAALRVQAVQDRSGTGRGVSGWSWVLGDHVLGEQMAGESEEEFPMSRKMTESADNPEIGVIRALTTELNAAAADAKIKIQEMEVLFRDLECGVESPLIPVRQVTPDEVAYLYYGLGREKDLPSPKREWGLWICWSESKKKTQKLEQADRLTRIHAARVLPQILDGVRGVLEAEIAAANAPVGGVRCGVWGCEKPGREWIKADGGAPLLRCEEHTDPASMISVFGRSLG